MTNQTVMANLLDATYGLRGAVQDGGTRGSRDPVIEIMIVGWGLAGLRTLFFICNRCTSVTLCSLSVGGSGGWAVLMDPLSDQAKEATFFFFG